jgi:hypothetical protein
MDELIAQLSQRTGLPPDKARQAAQVVIEHLKGRLPGPIANHLDQFLAGGSAGAAQGGAGAGGLADLAQGLGGMLDR